MNPRIDPPPSRTGRVALVGAGPGDPDLLTVKALRLLQSADTVLYDHLVSDEILARVAAGARKISVGKIGHGPSARQSEINALMIALARAGHRIVRLKAGDPLIFGRAGEEIADLEADGIAVDVIPGITAAQAAAATLRVSLTHRDHAQRFQVITGHARSGRLPDDLAWAAIADPRVTTAVYMAKHTIGALVERLIAKGLPQDCPAAAVFDASRPGERVVLCTLGALPSIACMHSSPSPCVVLIGEALRVRMPALAAKTAI